MDLDINTLVQIYNEKILQLTTDNVVKETRIRQMAAQIEALTASLVPEPQEKEKKTAKPSTQS